MGLTVAMFLRMTFCAPEWCSTITTWRAPREAASKPKAPVPANRSRIVPWKPSRASNRENMASRTRSEVGRVVGPGVAKRSEPALPAMIRVTPQR